MKQYIWGSSVPQNSEYDSFLWSNRIFSYSAAFPEAFTDSAVSCNRHDFLKRWKCWAQFSQNKDSIPSTRTLKKQQLRRVKPSFVPINKVPINSLTVFNCNLEWTFYHYMLLFYNIRTICNKEVLQSEKMLILLILQRWLFCHWRLDSAKKNSLFFTL